MTDHEYGRPDDWLGINVAVTVLMEYGKGKGLVFSV